MKRRNIYFGLMAVALIAVGVIAADHADSPTITGKTTDITDVYVFRAEDPNNLVFVMNTQGLLSPASTATAKFDENTLLEFNIDTNGDAVEDLVIQAIAKGGKMHIYGPYAPSMTGTKSSITGSQTVEVGITPYGSAAITATGGGVKAFAGPRDDPFFFDLTQFKHILDGTATGFNNPGTDAFAGTNVMSLVVEVPKTMLASSSTINVWAEAKKAQ